ncbi:type III-A CRISPR-associated RAMP protein Csm3 [Vulcanisaeta thermophila]|uniref:type III-A CRISPR-associated RAMP protein Csm3 n=1 Tax=Vulcanisaeta thermophila TaxID=867917 RepID=UPI000852FE37|nr:type III-A CRISPR-associated RAMP protein Csm3 [Vulcanisaeta thermophila]
MSVSPQLRLLGIFEVKFKLINVTGLLIRSGRPREILSGTDIQSLSIDYPYEVSDGRGGTRVFVINVPYIPGSSLKGRARSLLELALNLPLQTTDGKIYQHMKVVRNDIVDNEPYCPVDNIFGTNSIPPSAVEGISDEKEKELMRTLVLKCWAPGRAIFRDLFPSKEYIERLCHEKGGCDYVDFEDFIEEKWENRIDRVTSAADPRNIYRVKPGVEFSGSISMLVFDLDVCVRKECHELSNKWRFEYPAKSYMDYLLSSLELVEETYLGGSGSRGYGQVSFRDLSVDYYDASTGSISHLINAKSLAELRRGLRDHEIWNRIRSACGGAI